MAVRSDGVPRVTADRDRLVQVLINLLSNAVKVCHPGEGRVEIRLGASKGLLRVDVQDNGPGISPADHHTVFEKFRQVGDTLTGKPGWGCRSAGASSNTSAGASGWRASWARERRSRSCSRSRRRPREPTRRWRKSPGRSMTMGKRILIVEDEPNIVISLEFLMKREGFEVEVAADGEAALKAVAELAPDLVLLDIMLPKINGFEVCQKLRADPRWRGVKIVMLTAKGRETEITKGLALGADLYVTKPFSTKELVAQVKQLLGSGVSSA